MLNMCRQQQAEKLHVKIVPSKILREECRSTCAVIDLGSLCWYPMYIYQPDYSVFSQSYASAGCAFQELRVYRVNFQHSRGLLCNPFFQICCPYKWNALTFCLFRRWSVIISLNSCIVHHLLSKRGIRQRYSALVRLLRVGYEWRLLLLSWDYKVTAVESGVNAHALPIGTRYFLSRGSSQVRVAKG